MTHNDSCNTGIRHNCECRCWQGITCQPPKLPDRRMMVSTLKALDFQLDLSTDLLDLSTDLLDRMQIYIKYSATSIIQTPLATMPTWGYRISEMVWITEVLIFSLLFQGVST